MHENLGLKRVFVIVANVNNKGARHRYVGMSSVTTSLSHVLIFCRWSRHGGWGVYLCDEGRVMVLLDFHSVGFAAMSSEVGV